LAEPGAFTARDHPQDRATRLNLLRRRIAALEGGGGGGGGGSVSDGVYGIAWDGDTAVAPSRNAVYDKIETLASITYVNAQITGLIGTAPGILDTLGEISDAINDDANLYTTLVNLIAARAPIVLGIDTVAGAAYTFASADSWRHKRFTNAGAIVATVPTNAADPIPIGTRIRGTQVGAGTVTLTPSGGVTLNSLDAALKTVGQFAVFEIEKVAANEWDVLGPMMP
jgi:hypothetical protein